LRLRLPDGAAGAPSAVLCSLTEKELRSVPLTAILGGVGLDLELRPFQVVTLKLSL
jgi:hypothetical protein